jgi:hypothetical protein
MKRTSNYCKAYLAEELRRFPEWHERVLPLVVRLEEAADSGGATEYFFLHDDYVVTASVYRDEQVTFDHVTPDWKAFCEGVLNFKAPSAGQMAS